MQTASLFKQASIRPGNKTVPVHLVLLSAGCLQQNCAGVQGGEKLGEGKWRKEEGAWQFCNVKKIWRVY